MDYQAKAKAEHPAFDCTDLGKPRCNIVPVEIETIEGGFNAKSIEFRNDVVVIHTEGE